MTDPLATTEDLAPGDVVQVAIELPDKQRPGHTFWWKTFRVVLDVINSRHLYLLTLKMQVDPDKDVRTIDLADPRVVVTKLEEKDWPQGVIAMRIKHIATGLIKLGQV